MERAGAPGPGRVGAVGLPHASVRRVSGQAAGLLAGAVLALTGTDPFPTLERCQQYVHSGSVRYFLGGAMMSGETGSDLSAGIAGWVAANYLPTTAAGVSVYDLGGSQP